MEPARYSALDPGRPPTSAGGWVALQKPPTPRLSAAVGKAVRRVPAEGSCGVAAPLCLSAGRRARVPWGDAPVNVVRGTAGAGAALLYGSGDPLNLTGTAETSPASGPPDRVRGHPPTRNSEQPRARFTGALFRWIRPAMRTPLPSRYGGSRNLAARHAAPPRVPPGPGSGIELPPPVRGGGRDRSRGSGCVDRSASSWQGVPWRPP